MRTASPFNQTSATVPQPALPKPQPAARPEKSISLASVKIPRRSNPHDKIAGMESTNIRSSGGISTKQRLGQGALAPVAPKAVPASELNPSKKGSKSLPTRATTSTLMNLSFKKVPPPILVPSTGMQPGSAPTSAQQSPTYPMLSGSPVLQSPQIGFSSQAGTPPGSSIFGEVLTVSPINMSPTFSASKSTPTAPVSMVNTRAPTTNQSMSIDGTMSAFPIFAFYVFPP